MKRLISPVILTVIFCTLITAPLHAVPPTDEVIQRLIDEGRFDRYLQNIAQARAKGVDSPWLNPDKEGVTTALAPGVVFRVLVILVDFPDKPYTSGWAAGTPEMFDSLLFSTGKNPTGSMREFYIENSYGNFVLEGDVVGWYRAANNSGYYANNCDGSHGMGPYPNNAQRLVEEAVDAADAAVNFSHYDNNGNGSVDGIFVVHAGTGFEESSNDCEIHSHQWNITPRFKDGVQVSTYSIEPEETPSDQQLNAIGVFCHEFGHVLGLPDLYDTDGSSAGVGRWCLMASGSYNGDSKQPSHFSAWCKKQLGFLTATTVTTNQTNVPIPAVETSPTIFRLWQQGTGGNQYFLVENRQQIGSDAEIPNSGLLIWHIDESVSGNWNDWHPKVMLEQADGRFDLQNDANSGDGSDPFPNGGFAPNFTDKTNPNSRAYSGASTQVAVWNISGSSPTMTADFDVTWSRPYLYLTGSTFSDAAGGDGDGILEAGETINLTFSVANDWKSAVGASVTLTIDDATLGIVNGTASLGTIASGGVVNNNGSPLRFTVPVSYTPRIDSFYLTITSDGGAFVTVLPVEKKVGKPVVLLVDDDNGDVIDSFVTGAGYVRRMPFDVWNKAVSGSPSGATLDQYQAVVWGTGDYRAAPLTTSDINAMTSYLDNGGSLFLSGQGIAQQLSTLNPGFLANYLRVNYLANTLMPIVVPEVGSPVMSGLDSLALQGPGSANNTTKTDRLSPVNGGVAEAHYMLSSDVAAVSYAGAYKLVYFGYGFESITRTDPRWEKRDTVFERVMTYLGIPWQAGYPTIPTASIGPGSPANMIDHTPDFTWTFYSSGGETQQQYHIQVGTDSDWGIVEKWDSGPVTSAASAVTYAGSALLDGQTYFFRIRVFNGIQWSTWRSDYFRMNSTPSVPVSLIPSQLAGMGSATPALQSQLASDPEVDVLTYSYEVSDDSLMSNIVASASGQPPASGYTSWTVSPPLSDEGIYYWRIRAFDGFEYGAWSSPASFWVNSINQLPAAFALMLPAHGSQVTVAHPTFNWGHSSDADRFDSVTYTFYLSADSLFGTADSAVALPDTEYVYGGNLAVGSNFWRVAAVDKFGGRTYATVFRFQTGLPGDASGDGFVNVGDVVYLVNYIFKSGPAPNPLASGDANGTCDVNVGDAVYLINYIFKSGPVPVPGCAR